MKKFPKALYDVLTFIVRDYKITIRIAGTPVLETNYVQLMDHSPYNIGFYEQNGMYMQNGPAGEKAEKVWQGALWMWEALGRPIN